jgi:glycosyltransferase involved in cell wall biosynthesis
LKICEFFYLKQIQHFLTVSEFIKSELLDSFKFLDEERIVTVHHGVDTQFFLPNKEDSFVKNNGPIILFTGRFVAKKGPHILIRAMPKILKSVPDACFVFVGSGDFTPYLRMIKDNKIPEDNFKLLGYVAGSELPKIYNSATLYAAPSFEDSLGIRILEAMSCEKAVVASNIGGVPEIINDGKNGFLVSPGDVNKLAEKIIMLLEDENLRKKIAVASRRTVLEKFSVVRMANQTARLYNEILNNN